MTDSFFRFFSRADRPLNFLSPFYLSMSVFFVCVYVCVGGGGGVCACVCVCSLHFGSFLSPVVLLSPSLFLSLSRSFLIKERSPL